MPPTKSFKHAKPVCTIGVISPLPELARGSLALAIVQNTSINQLPPVEQDKLFNQMMRAWSVQAKAQGQQKP